MPNASRQGSRNLLSFLPCQFSLAKIGIAQSSYQPSPENLQARREFQDMKFGMFIHWGVYSVLGDGEWVFHDRKLKVDEYNRLPMFFDPEKFDAHDLGLAGEIRRDEVHHHHLAPSRRLRDVRLEGLRLEHRRSARHTRKIR